MRILGKGKTAQAIKEVYSDAVMFDDGDKQSFDYTSDELTIVSPGIPPSNYLVQNTKNICSDYDLFLNNAQFTIWISGTNGKTTTTGMIYHLLKNKGFFCGGNIGTPLAHIAHEKKLVLETSSFTLHYTNKAKPNIYVLLPIREDHISWHGNFNEYEKSKLKPLTLMDKEDVAIIPIEYKNISSECKVYYYSNVFDISAQFDIMIEKVHFKEPFLIDSILALCVEKILYDTASYEKINSFQGDPHKIEEFKDKQGRVWVDDSKATNVDATIQALKSYKEKKIYLILGGDDKGADLAFLFEELKKYDVEICCIGSNTDKLHSLARKVNVTSYPLKTLEKAVASISQKLTLDEVALLSPAAASLDQFSSYKHRGEDFKKLVNLEL
jgi:UDP-N-acetylmuramoylalanine--D-glutamate ligase